MKDGVDPELLPDKGIIGNRASQYKEIGDMRTVTVWHSLYG